MDSISAFLNQDHAYCDSLFDQVEHSVRESDWQQAADHMRRFIRAMEGHIAMEEKVLFQAFERMQGQPCYPLAMLRIEHRHLEMLIRRTLGAVLDAAAVDFALHAETLTLLKQQHSAKEDVILYPMLDKLLARERAPLLAQMRALRGGDLEARSTGTPDFVV